MMRLRFGLFLQGIVGTYSAIMVTNLSEASVHGHYLTENWVGVLGITASLTSTTASILSGRAKLTVIKHNLLFLLN